MNNIYFQNVCDDYKSLAELMFNDRGASSTKGCYKCGGAVSAHAVLRRRTDTPIKRTGNIVEIDYNAQGYLCSRCEAEEEQLVYVNSYWGTGDNGRENGLRIISGPSRPSLGGHFDHFAGMPT